MNVTNVSIFWVCPLRHRIQRRNDLRKCRSFVRILLDTRLDEGLERWGAPPGYFWPLISIQDGQSALNGTHAFVGTLPGQELGTDNAVTIDIGFFIVTLVGQDFGGHPLHRSTIARHGSFLSFQTAQAKVAYLGGVRFTKKNA